MNKESHSYYLRDLFSKIHIISPKQINVGDPSSVTIKWEGKTTSHYDLYYSTDPNFTEIVPVMVAVNHSFFHNGIIFGSLFFGIVLMGGIKRKMIRSLLIVTSLFVILIGFLGCQNEITSPSQTEVSEISRTIENLESNSTYFWKIVAHPAENNYFSSETVVQTFTTGS